MAMWNQSSRLHSLRLCACCLAFSVLNTPCIRVASDQCTNSGLPTEKIAVDSMRLLLSHLIQHAARHREIWTRAHAVWAQEMARLVIVQVFPLLKLAVEAASELPGCLCLFNWRGNYHKVPDYAQFGWRFV